MKHKNIPAETTFDDSRANFLVYFCPDCDQYTHQCKYNPSYKCAVCFDLSPIVAIMTRRIHRTPNESYSADISLKSLDPIAHPEGIIIKKLRIRMSTSPLTYFPELSELISSSGSD